MSDSSLFSSHERIFPDLNDENFLEWKDNMQGLLMARGLLAHIKTTRVSASAVTDEEKKEAKAATELWDRDEQKAAGAIFMKVGQNQRVHLLSVEDSARSMWTKICAKHEQVGTQLAVSCVSGLFHTRYQDGAKLEDHLAKVRQWLTRIEGSGNVLTEPFKVALVLNTLPPSWAVFKEIHIVASDQTVSSLCIAAQAERDRRLNEQRNVEVTQALAQQQLADSPSALAVREQQAAAARAGSRPVITCAFCSKQGHEEKDCWDKHGRPARTARRNNANLATEPAASPPNSGYHVYTALSTTPAVAGVWYLDSGASNHYCREAGLVDSVTPCAKPSVVSADGSNVPIVGTGSVTITVSPARSGLPDRVIKLTDVSLVPGLATNLVSVARLTKAGLDVRFSTSLCVIRHGKQVVAVADLDKANNLYRLRIAGRAEPRAAAVGSPQPQYCLAAGEEAKLLPSALWHQRLGHVHHRAVAHLLDSGMTADVHQTIGSNVATCHACIQGKHHRAAVPADARAQHRADRPLYRLHLDICGPFREPALDGSRYLLQIVDDYSRYVWSRAMVDRKAATILGFVKQFVTMAEAMHSGHRVSSLRSDNGPELVEGVFSDWLKERGIQRELTATYTSYQNGVVERMNRTIVEMGRTMLAASCLPPSFWALAMDTAVYCRNRCPTTTLDGRTPYEAWCGSKPRVKHMRIFGCLAYAHVRKPRQGKLGVKAEACIFVGYSADSTTYRLWNQESRTLINSRDVYFVEGQLGIKAGGDR